MQSVELNEVSLRKDWKDLLLKAGFITATEVLVTNVQLLSQRTKLSIADINELLLELSFSFRKGKIRSVANILGMEERERGELEGASSEDQLLAEVAYKKSQNWISLGDENLDSLLGNGIKIGGITEIAGESASGKSHLCLQLALTVQLPHSLGGQAGGTILVSSEGIVPSSRLLSIAQSLITRLPEGLNDRNEWDYLDNVHVEKAQDVENLEALLSFIAPARIDRVNLAASQGLLLTSDDSISPLIRTSPPLPPLPIKLLIIDSIAAPFRAAHENDSFGFIARAKEFAIIGDRLKKLSNVYDLAIVVVNQVSDVFNNGGVSHEPDHYLILPDDLVEDEEIEGNISITPSRSTSVTSTSLSRSTSLNTRTLPSTTPYYTQQSTRPPPRPSIPAHIQYKLPSYLYDIYQRPHFSGQGIINISQPRQAALGHTWTNIINTRIMLSRTKRLYEFEGEGEGEGGQRRRMELIFSPSAARGGVDYALEEGGLRSLGVPDWREI